MPLSEFLNDIWDWGQTAAAALAPAALGSAVGQAWRPSLSWRQRLVQWVTGICVSYYVTMAASELFDFSPFVAQAVGFVIAMVAFEAAPKFTRAAGDLAAEIPGLLRSFLGRAK